VGGQVRISCHLSRNGFGDFARGLSEMQLKAAGIFMTHFLVSIRRSIFCSKATDLEVVASGDSSS